MPGARGCESRVCTCRALQCPDHPTRGQRRTGSHLVTAALARTFVPLGRAVAHVKQTRELGRRPLVGQRRAHAHVLLRPVATPSAPHHHHGTISIKRTMSAHWITEAEAGTAAVPWCWWGGGGGKLTHDGRATWNSRGSHPRILRSYRTRPISLRAGSTSAIASGAFIWHGCPWSYTVNTVPVMLHLARERERERETERARRRDRHPRTPTPARTRVPRVSALPRS
jgi:hypothetical protein